MACPRCGNPKWSFILNGEYCPKCNYPGKEKKKVKDNSWIWVALILIGICVLLSWCDLQQSNPIPTSTPLLNNDGCPKGCTYHKTKCDIKGNISFGTKERIYHVPGGAFYNSTTINPDYGERWFCTEEEAKANGWRKSYK